MNQPVLKTSRFPFLNVGFLQSRLSWSIRLRWIAAGGFFFATLVAKYFLGINIPFENIWFLLAVLLGINAVYYIILKIVEEISLKTEIIFLNIHIVIDLLILTVLVHFSGGIDNPIFFFYVFHVVVSSILFSRTVALAYATSVVILFSLLIYLEFKKIIPHYALYEKTLYDNTLFIYLLLAVFIITVYVTAYICMTFMQIFRESKRKIDQLNEELIIADEEKTKFFRFTSHELKSPIIAIKTSIDGVLNKFGKSFDSRAFDLLNRASLRAGQMLDIIKELIELSRNRDLLAREKVPSDPLDLAQILKQAIQNETAYAEQKQIEIRTHCPDHLPIIFGRSDDFEKIFRNLVNNAIRYTDRGGEVRISAECENKRMIFRFEDTGIGIPEEDINKIFDEFYRSENAKKIVTFGTGLGLSLTRQLLVKYNGNIDVKSKLNEGTVFSVTIPVPESAS